MSERTPQPGTRLVGRKHELAALVSQFEKATAGLLSVTLVTGEAGLGKTRLLSEFAQHAAQAGALVLRGGASEAEGMPPYLPFLEALGNYIRVAPLEQLRSQVEATAPILATILPELPEKLGELPPSYPLPVEQARLRLYEAIGLFLATIATSRPLLLILDDLQWADTSTLDLLCHIAQHQVISHLCILGAYRSDELANHAGLERCILNLTRHRQLLLVELQPLNEADVAELVTCLLGTPPDRILNQRLSKESEGNPFFLEEVVHAWQASGILTLTPSSASISSSLEAQLPASLNSLVRQRLSHLPQPVLETLRSAAIIGRTFEGSLLAEVIGQDEELVEERLLNAVQAGILRYAPLERYTFSHDILRTYLYNEVTPGRKRRLHGFIGGILEAHLDQESAHQLAQLAFHFAQSGDRARGARYSRLAAEQAMQAAAPFEALHYYQMALNLLDQQDQQCGSLWLALGEAALNAGVENTAVQAFETAQAWWTSHPDTIAAARAAYGQGRARARLEEHAAAQAELEQALTLLRAYPCPEQVQVLVELATLQAVSRGRYAEGMVYGQQALELASQLGDKLLQAMAGRVVGNLLVRGNELSRGIALLEHALSLAIAVDAPGEAIECCSCLNVAYFWSGQIHHMRDSLLRQTELVQRCQQPYQLRHIYSWLAGCMGILGNFAEARQWVTLAETAIASLSSPEPLAFLLQIRGILAVYHHNYEEAEVCLSQAVAIFRQMGPAVLIWYLPILGWTQSLLGKREETLASLEESEVLLGSQEPGTIITGTVSVYHALMALFLEDRERVARALTDLHPFQGLYLDGLVDRMLAELYIFQQAWSDAHTCLNRAETRARQEELLAELALIQMVRARLVLAQGGRGSTLQARSLLEQALTLFQQMDLPGQVLAIRTELERLPERAIRNTPPRPAGLSPREIEVLRLVAAGKSNRQIAEELVLSEKTIANHLARIFARTGTDNRAAAAAFAIRSGIA